VWGATGQLEQERGGCNRLSECNKVMERRRTKLAWKESNCGAKMRCG
jgi:hypothetical protein